VADGLYQLSLSMKPSELWRRQGYSTYQHEVSVATMVPLIGEDTIMWGSDYPHPDGIWPDSQHWIAKDVGSLSPAIQRKISARTPASCTGSCSRRKASPSPARRRDRICGNEAG
jgi:hypothetical protein